MTSNDFFIDTTGDETLLYESQENQVNWKKSKSSKKTVKGENFIPLSVGTKAPADPKNKPKNKGKNKKNSGFEKRKIFVPASGGGGGGVETAETQRRHQDLVLQDYLENCDPIDFTASSSLGNPFTLLASTNMEDDDSQVVSPMVSPSKHQLAESSDDEDQKADLPEQGYYDTLMASLDDEESQWEDVNSSDEDDDVPAATHSHSQDEQSQEEIEEDFNDSGSDFDYEYEMAAIQQEFGNTNLSGTESFDDDDDILDLSSDKKIKAFTGGSSTWAMDPKKLEYMLREQENDEAFERQLDADFDTDSDSTDQGDKKQSKTQRRKAKKRAKREERAVARQQSQDRRQKANELDGILRQSGRNVGRDLQTYLDTINTQLHRFANDEGQGDCLLLPPMPSGVRQLVVALCKLYFIKPKIRGSGKKKSMLVFRTGTTLAPPHWKGFVSQVTGSGQPIKLKGNINGFQHRTKAKSKGANASDQATSAPKVGTKVGDSAKPIDGSNVGHKMMRLMGWNPGESLGVSGASGIVDPINATIRGKRAGLGA